MPTSRRHRFARAAATATVTAGAAVLTALAPAGATAPSADEQLFLTVSGSGNTWIRGVQLVCPDTLGSHPEGVAACDALIGAAGDLNRLPGDPRACTREYDPVTATAKGTWQGRPVEWTKSYPNSCTLESATGAVFRF
ncbi:MULTISPECIES: SSI family serine proteinase inhibitor [unclassified Streptomyces]|uniref:SSI family serine proteinase inhibitor n=1 Tax=unclassified Streptomyces TaxID=2593676 RepID=UPI003818DA93